MAYFNENRTEFERSNPTVTPAELTKIAMNKYKQLYPGKANGSTPTIDASNGSTAKRKINTDDNERSAVAKLARFSFKKQ